MTRNLIVEVMLDLELSHFHSLLLSTLLIIGPAGVVAVGLVMLEL